MSFRAPTPAEVTRPTVLGDADVLYFLHIPRTGGTTLHELLEAWFPPEGVLKAGSRGEVPNRLEEIGSEGRAGLRFFSGHYDTNVTRLLGRTPRFITMLREPIARTMSHYEIIKRMPNHKLHDEVTVGGMTFLDYLHDPRGGIADRDRQVRQIAGVMDAAPDAPYPPRRAPPSSNSPVSASKTSRSSESTSSTPNRSIFSPIRLAGKCRQRFRKGTRPPPGITPGSSSPTNSRPRAH